MRGRVMRERGTAGRVYDLDREKERQGTRSSSHTSNEVTQHYRAGGKRLIPINATYIPSRQKWGGQTRAKGDTRIE